MRDRSEEPAALEWAAVAALGYDLLTSTVVER
jgi:hypothetical protein